MHDKLWRGAGGKCVVRALHGRRVWQPAGPPKTFLGIRSI